MGLEIEILNFKGEVIKRFVIPVETIILSAVVAGVIQLIRLHL